VEKRGNGVTLSLGGEKEGPRVNGEIPRLGYRSRGKKTAISWKSEAQGYGDFDRKKGSVIEGGQKPPFIRNVTKRRGIACWRILDGRRHHTVRSKMRIAYEASTRCGRERAEGGSGIPKQGEERSMAGLRAWLSILEERGWGGLEGTAPGNPGKVRLKFRSYFSQRSVPLGLRRD